MSNLTDVVEQTSTINPENILIVIAVLFFLSLAIGIIFLIIKK